MAVFQPFSFLQGVSVGPTPTPTSSPIPTSTPTPTPTSALVFNFTYDKKVTNIGSAGSLDPNVNDSNVRNNSVTYNPSTDSWWVFANGGGTPTYHWEYDYGTSTNSYRGEANPDRGNRGIAWDGSYYVETIFANSSNVKFNPTRIGKYTYDSVNVEMDLVGSEVNGPNDDMRNIAYSTTTGKYYVLTPDQNKINVLDSSFTQTTTFSISGFNYESGIAVSDNFGYIFVLNRDADGSGNNFIKRYDLTTGTYIDNLILLGSDMGSYFRLGGIAVDDVNNRLLITHNNGGAGSSTQDLSEGWFYDLV